MSLDREFQMTLCLIASTLLWLSVLIILTVGSIQNREYLMHWGVALAPLAATLSVRRMIKRHDTDVRESFEMGRESERVLSGPRKIS